jgi:uncharacterized membrane protein YdbT with pleckstrin-like domain
MQQLHPKSVWLFFFTGLFQLLIFMIFLSIWLGTLLLNLNIMRGISGYVAFAIIIFVILIFLLYIWARLSYRFYRYELTEDGFKKELGVIYKKYVTIPYERIQNVDIYRGILARILGLSDLNIQTAGASAQVNRHGVFGAGAEGRLPGLLHADAEKLRDELIKRAKHSGNQGL